MTVSYGGHQGLQYSEHVGVELVVVEVERENPSLNRREQRLRVVIGRRLQRIQNVVGVNRLGLRLRLLDESIRRGGVGQLPARRYCRISRTEPPGSKNPGLTSRINGTSKLRSMRNQRTA
jgi:hypothetical protein